LSPKYQLFLVTALAIIGALLIVLGLLFFAEGLAFAFYLGALSIVAAITLAVHWGFLPYDVNM
jgi:hypothetical protein